MFDSNLKAKWDYENSIAFAEERGERRGEQIGAQRKALAIALEFKKMGLSVEDIAKGTGLSVEEIEKL